MANSFTNLLYHIVFSTKQREPLIVSSIRSELYAYIGGIVRGEGGVLLEIGGMPDHIHVLAKFKSEPSVAEMVKIFKAKSSKWANERVNKKSRFSWQTGYGAFTVSSSQLGKVRQYIQNQEQHHRVTTFKEEFIALLKKHGVEFDERYLWD